MKGYKQFLIFALAHYYYRKLNHKQINPNRLIRLGAC